MGGGGGRFPPSFVNITSAMMKPGTNVVWPKITNFWLSLVTNFAMTS